MKFFSLFLLLAFYYVQATPIINIHLPQKTKSQLCQKLSDHECLNEEQLQYKKYCKLDNDKLLLFFNTYNQNALYPNGSLNVPVTVDINGRWQVINSYISDEIQAVVHDPHGGIWLHTMSERKNGYSSLYYSRHGEQWKKIKLPSIRTFQTLKLCFQENDIILTFQRVENDNVKAWITAYSDALSDEPTWRLMEKKELYQKVCQKTSAYNNAWYLKSKETSRTLLFKHKYRHVALSFPQKSFSRLRKRVQPPITVLKQTSMTMKTTPVVDNYASIVPRRDNRKSQKEAPALYTYTIQLGTFNYKSSLPLIYQEFNRLKNGLVTKKIFNGQRIQYKIFLEKFRDIHEAKIRLGEIRSEYSNSKTAKNAFVTQIPSKTR